MSSQKGNILIIIPSLIAIIALVTAGYFFFQTQQLKSPTPVVRDETANWKTYTNLAFKITFRYPPTWTLENKGDQGDISQYNAQLILTKDQAIIQMYLNMTGLGGKGQTYQGQQFMLDGNNLYRFVKTNSYNNTQTVGISTSLTNTLGVFEIKGKTYSITLTYPMNDTRKETGNFLEKEFDQILGTFKFLD